MKREKCDNGQSLPPVKRDVGVTTTINENTVHALMLNNEKEAVGNAKYLQVSRHGYYPAATETSSTER